VPRRVAADRVHQEQDDRAADDPQQGVQVRRVRVRVALAGPQWVQAQGRVVDSHRAAGVQAALAVVAQDAVDSAAARIQGGQAQHAVSVRRAASVWASNAQHPKWLYRLI
jgi:hypothetical protein